MVRLSFFTLLSLIISLQALAQTKFLDSVKTVYADQKAVYLKESTTLRYSVQDDSLRLVVENHSDKLILSDNANLFSEKNIYHSGLIRIKNLEAKTIVYNGTKE